MSNPTIEVRKTDNGYGVFGEMPEEFGGGHLWIGERDTQEEALAFANEQKDRIAAVQEFDVVDLSNEEAAA